MADFFRALARVQFKIRLAPDMTIENYEGTKEVLRKLIKNAHPTMESWLNGMFQKDTFVRQFVEPLFSPLPTRAVRTGQTWTRNDVLDLGPTGTYSTVHRYTYEGMVGQLDRIKVESALTYKGPKEKGDLPFTILSSSKLESHAKRLPGLIRFDRHKGRMVSALLPQKLTGTLMIDIGGIMTTVQLLQEQTTSIKITDTNPLR